MEAVNNMTEWIIRIIISVIILIVLIIILSKFRARKSEPDKADSLAIMKKRLEEGEITEEEFEEAKRRRGK